MKSPEVQRDFSEFLDSFNAAGVKYLGQVPVPFLGRLELLANKRATGRAKDLGDVEALRGPRANRRGTSRGKAR